MLAPGEHKLRFEGVADGIDPASAIVTGLPSGVIEKNRDAALLSPAALIEKAQEGNGRVLLTRTNPKTGVTTRTEGKILSGADGGVVFQTANGIGAATLRDIAVNEVTEFRLEEAGADVQAAQVVEQRIATGAPSLRMLPGPGLRGGYRYDNASRVDLTNARPNAVQIEVRLTLSDNQRLVRADQPVSTKNGRPIFRVTVPSNGSLTIRYQTASMP